MKTIIKICTVAFGLSGVACDDDSESGISQDEAARLAQEAIGGIAGEAERSTVGDLEVWEVYVAMPNKAEVEVKLELATGDVVLVEDDAGPFDYPDFTPIAGVLSYNAIKALALEEVAGDITKWEFKREGEAGGYEFEFEFYIRDAQAQLWEIYFDATDGTAKSIEAIDSVEDG